MESLGGGGGAVGEGRRIGVYRNWCKPPRMHAMFTGNVKGKTSMAIPWNIHVGTGSRLLGYPH